MKKTVVAHAVTPRLCSRCEARAELEVENAPAGLAGVALRWCEHRRVFADIRFRDRSIVRWELAGPVDDAFVAQRMSLAQIATAATPVQRSSDSRGPLAH